MMLCDFINNCTHQGAEVQVIAEVQIIITAECNPVYSHLYAEMQISIHVGLNSLSSIVTMYKMQTK